MKKVHKINKETHISRAVIEKASYLYIGEIVHKKYI